MWLLTTDYWLENSPGYCSGHTQTNGGPFRMWCAVRMLTFNCLSLIGRFLLYPTF
ncbi:GH12931 [Drosophila grimshawi]|uniref:GH12931 n=1 Tax=Drosophila grimshawi TaxID=7222 RepID=B4K347_DROGR|nr:GH12931 [Drosophila grimshawi]